uniref:ADP-ribosylation factor-like 10 isoform X1 n=1 Tax=Solea senegalensis TaxID=28829 RepID=UPI001CD88DBC|nr:ADP-ribosylation factor-like 10 isoform X1 [Solea senegalensis]
MVLLQNISDMLSAAVAAFGSALFISVSVFYRRRTLWSERTQLCAFTEKAQEAEHRKRQVLVLGLDGAGKSSLLRGMVPAESTAQTRHSRPTHGFNFVSLDTGVCRLDFLEIGSSEELRRHWSEYVKHSHILVFVVDSTDQQRLPLAKAELHRLLGAEPRLPVVVLGNKQDKPGAVSVCELHDALSLHSHNTFLIAAQMHSDEALKNSCWSPDQVQELLLLLV